MSENQNQTAHVTAMSESTETAPVTPRVLKLEKLDYDFKRQDLLDQALTHKSYRHENALQGTDNEKLEFLGDAVLDLALSEVLMSLFSGDNEGSLSKKRASLVNEDSLSGIARSLGIDSILRMGKGERQTGGDKKPRLLASSLEAVIGAVFLDSGYPAAFTVVRAMFADRLKEIANTPDFATDFKTRLQESVQESHRTAPSYRVLNESGPDHDKLFEISVSIGELMIAQGQGRSKKAAEQEAARKALDVLTQPPIEEPESEPEPATELVQNQESK